MKTAKTYTKASGDDPFTLWANKLDKKLRARVYKKVSSLEAENYSECSILKDADGVKEARIHTASGLRIYFAEENNEIIILLAGGDKDTQNRDIEKAKEYWNDYKRRLKS